MRRISMSEFRTTFHKLHEPVELLRGVETIGYYYPFGTRPAQDPTINKVASPAQIEAALEQTASTWSTGVPTAMIRQTPEIRPFGTSKPAPKVGPKK